MSLKYKIALINVFWEEEDIDTRFFESVESQTDYFEMKASGKYSTLSNFPVNNNIDTRIVYKDTTGRDIRELVASNYAVVKRFDDETNEVLEYRYYFAYCKQDSGTQIAVTLSLDDIQTNYFKYKDKINKCEIRRANLNRFIGKGNDTYTFNNLTNSPLFLKENLGEFPKRLINRKKVDIKLDFGAGESALNKWLADNVSGWNYIFVRGDRTYNGYTFVEVPDEGYIRIDYGEALVPIKTIKYESNILGTGGVICVPIYKTSNRIKIIPPNGSGYMTIDNTALTKFRENNNDASFFLSNKVSLRPPFLTDVYMQGVSDDYEIVDNDLVINRNTSSQLTSEQLKLKGCNIMYTSSEGNPLIIVNQSEGQFQTNEFSLSKKIEFNRDEIVGVERDFRLNPKLLSNDFFDFNITNGTAENFTYDFQKIGIKNMQLYYTETLTPDITKAYTRLNSTLLSTGGYIYYGDSYKAFIGLLYTNDNSIPYDNDALQAMLANNKNYFIQNTFNRDFGALKSGFNSAMTFDIRGIMGGGYNTALNYHISKVNEDYNVDNMRYAPSEVKNVNGSVLFANDVSEIGIYVEEYEALPQSLESANDYMYQFGFKYGRLGYLSDFDNIRYYFNYIEASLNVIDAPISLDEKRRLKDRFNRGVRFWNSDTIQYDMENYERMLITNE